MTTNQEIRFRAVLDDTGMPASAKRAEDTLQGMGRAAHNANLATKAFGNQTKLTGQQLAALSQQTSDIAVTLAGGVNPLMVALQQLPQLSGQLGGMGNVFRAYLSLLTPINVGLGGLGLAVGGAAIAMGQGYLQADRLTKSLALTGNAAGVTRGQVEAMAQSMADRTNTAVGDMSAALREAAASGVFMGQNVGLAGRAAAELGKLSGESAEAIVKDFARMGSGVTQYAVEANRKYNFLTVEIYRQIKALEQQGKTQEAQRLLLDQLATTMETRSAPAIGNLERAYNTLANAASSAWKAMLGWGTPETPESRLEKLKTELMSLMEAGSKFAGGEDPRPLMQSRMAQLRQQIAQEATLVYQGQQKTEADAKAAAATRATIEKDSSGKFRSEEEARLALGQSQSQKRLADAIKSAETEQTILERKYAAFEITAAEYENGRIAAARAQAAAEMAAAQDALRAAQARPASNDAERMQRQAAVIQAEIEEGRKVSERIRLEADILAGKFNATPRNVAESPEVDFRRSEKAADPAVDADLERRRAQAQQQAAEMLQTTRELNLALITDDRARGQATIAEEERVMRARIDLGSLSVERRAEVEEAFAQWRLMRESQLNEQLKPEWQRRQELWADTTRYMADSYNEFMDGFVSAGRESFSQWLQDGKITASSLANYIRAQFAKMAYERFLSSYVASAGKLIFDTFFGTGSGGATTGGAGAPDDVPTRGGRAFGGQVPAYTAWTVGERGPEKLIMGSTGGVIVPNGGMQAPQQPMQIVQHFHTTGNESQAQMYQLAAMARDSAVAAVAEHMARGTAAFRR